MADVHDLPLRNIWLGPWQRFVAPGAACRRQRHGLPAFGAEANIALDKFPNDQLFVGEESRPAMKFLPHQGGCAAVADEGGDRLLKFARQMRHKARRPGFVLLGKSLKNCRREPGISRPPDRPDRAVGCQTGRFADRGSPPVRCAVESAGPATCESRRPRGARTSALIRKRRHRAASNFGS